MIQIIKKDNRPDSTCFGKFIILCTNDSELVKRAYSTSVENVDLVATIESEKTPDNILRVIQLSGFTLVVTDPFDVESYSNLPTEGEN